MDRKLSLKTIIGGEKGKKVEKKDRKQEEERKGEKDEEARSSRADEATSAASRSRSVSVRRRRNSRDSSAGSKRIRTDDSVNASECEMSDNESVRGELNVCADLSASVATVRESEDVEKEAMDSMHVIAERVRKYVLSDSNRVSKSMSDVMLGCVSDFQQIVVKLLCRNERLKGRLDELEKRESACVCRPVQGASVRTFASVTGTKKPVNQSVNVKTGVREPVMRVSEPKYAVVIKPKDESVRMTSEEVKTKLMNEVSKCLNVRVKAVRKTRSGGIAVETVSASEMQRVRECKKFAEIGMRVDEPRKIGAKIIVFDVPCEIPSEDLLCELYEKNLKECVSESEFKKSVRVVSRTNKKDANVGNVIFEMGVRMWNRMIAEGRMYVGWKACKLREFVSVLRCHKCCAFGHMAKECKEKESVCQRCGESGHLRSACKKDECCRNCRVKGLKSNHSVTSSECPEYVRMVERERARINAE